MSEPLNSYERELRAFDALIVSSLLRERDFADLNDLPQLSASERIAMNALPGDLVDKLWDSPEDSDLMEREEIEEQWFEESELFAGANRADDMDEGTFKKLQEARNIAREAMRKKAQGGNDAIQER
jgi:hypothetical protein